MKRLHQAIAAAIGVAVVIGGGTWAYIHLVSDPIPPRLALDTEGAPASGPTDGVWRASNDSIAGYRVGEVLFGQSTEAVGRTHRLTGAMTIAGTTIDEATFSVDMSSVKSDDSRRDRQFNGRVMETSRFPKATFKLTEPVHVESVPTGRETITATATGDLTLKGSTRSVSIDITAQRDGARIVALLTYPVVFADWNIDNPSLGPVQTKNRGLLEVRLVLDRT